MKKTGSKILFYSIFGLILMLSVTLVKNVIRTNQIREQIEAEKVKIAKIQAENDKLASEVANTQSAEFIEREMRNKLGLGKEGEAIVVLPDPDALRKLAPVIPVEVDTLPDPNWRKWVHLFTSK
jgi:cell division protein FtsB